MQFKDDSFSTWFVSTKDIVNESLAIFSRDFSGFSVAHAEFSAITSLVNYQFLPITELEVAYSGYFTFVEPATLQQP